MTGNRPRPIALAGFAALSLGALLAACAVAEARTGAGAGEPAQSAAEQRQCFFAREVNGFRSPDGEDGRRDEGRVLIDVGPSDTYEFELMRRCSGLRFARSIRLVRQGPGRICDGFDVDLVVGGDIGPTRCPVTMVRKLAPGEPGARAGARE